MSSFVETQRFRQWWLWVLLGAVFLSTTLPLLGQNAGPDSSDWIGSVVALLIAGLFYIWRLDTRLDSEGIHYRVFPILGWRSIPWNTIQSANVAEYGFVGYGIRLGFDGWLYNIAGSKGIRITRINNSRITIGTQCPEAVEAFLKAHFMV